MFRKQPFLLFVLPGFWRKSTLKSILGGAVLLFVLPWFWRKSTLKSILGGGVLYAGHGRVPPLQPQNTAYPKLRIRPLSPSILSRNRLALKFVRRELGSQAESDESHVMFLDRGLLFASTCQFTSRGF